ncbi:MAG: DUF1570 domain-containing protein [Planctomycetes bacterium]|nr:DUF1570 domain-containing protein [Planctomycetota bacterium]
MSTLALCTLVLACGEARLTDRVELNDGTVLEGRVVYTGEDEFVLRVGTKDRDIRADTIRSVYSRIDNQREAIDRWIRLGPEDLAGNLDLAQFCKRHDLLEEMELVAWWILAQHPSNEDAHLFLGHEKVKDGWLVRDGARRVSFDKYLNSHAEWSDAWQLRTAHYVVRTNLPLREAVTTAFDLECHYRVFFDLFARPVRIMDVTEPMIANVHADARSFARVTGDRTAYFNPASRALEVDASKGLDTRLMMHEATHAVLHATAVSTRSATGVIPGWLDEGLAEYMAGVLVGEPGRARFSEETYSSEHFKVHADARNPYDLSRVLNFGASDFAASTRADLKYAQAYTLVHFGLQGERGAYRTRFLAFMRGAYAGQASQTHFKDALELDATKLERAWTTYVKALAGR